MTVKEFIERLENENPVLLSVSHVEGQCWGMTRESNDFQELLDDLKYHMERIEQQDRQLKWLASRTVDGTCPVPANECPEPDEYKQESCVQCWLEAAKRNAG